MLVNVPRFITAYLRRLFKVPVGFQWFGDGLLDSSLGLGSEENAETSLSHLDGTGWTTDKDEVPGFAGGGDHSPDGGRDPGETLTSGVKFTELAGEKIHTLSAHAPWYRRAPNGGLKVVAESGWFAARSSGTENIYEIYAESFRGADICAVCWRKPKTTVSNALATVPEARQRSHAVGNSSEEKP